MMGTRLEVKFVLTDWQKDDKSVYHDADVGVSNGVFHAGSTFGGVINIETTEQADELRQALADGYRPVFVME